MGTQSISHGLLQHLDTCLRGGIATQRRRITARHGINGHFEEGWAAYPTAIAAWEAFLYETLLSAMPRAVTSGNMLWALPDGTVDRWDIVTKTECVPRFLFGESFIPGQQPLQDFQLLVQVRNEIVHFKNEDRVPKAVRTLQERGIFLRSPQTDADYPWPATVACTEGVRFAINTLHAMATELNRVASLPGNKAGFMVQALSSNFRPFSEADVRAIYAACEVNPDEDP